jgi:Tfp pilus assembly protein PilF
VRESHAIPVLAFRRVAPFDDVPEMSRERAESTSDGAVATGLIEKGEDLNDAGAYLEAIESLQRAIEVGPGSARAFVALAWAYENLGPEHAAEAEAAYHKALSLDPSNRWAKEGLAHQLELQGDAEKARRLYRSAVDDPLGAESSNPDVLEIVAWCQHRLGEENDAERTYRRALEIEPDRAATRFDLALTLFLLGRDEEALSESSSALAILERGPHDVHRATVQVALDDLEEALALHSGLDSNAHVGRARVAMEAVVAALPEP